MKRNLFRRGLVAALAAGAFLAFGIGTAEAQGGEWVFFGSGRTTFRGGNSYYRDVVYYGVDVYAPTTYYVPAPVYVYPQPVFVNPVPTYNYVNVPTPTVVAPVVVYASR